MPESVLNIMVLSRSASDLEYVRNLLTDGGRFRFECLHCESLDQALSELKNHPVDAVIYEIHSDSYRREFGQLKEARSPLAILALGEAGGGEHATQVVLYGAQDYLVRGQEDGREFSRALQYAVEREKIDEALRCASDELETRIEERTATLKELNEKLQKEIDERRRTNEVLQQEHDFVRALVNTVDAIVIVLDSEGHIESVNRCFELKTGLSNAEVAGKSMAQVVSGHEGKETDSRANRSSETVGAEYGNLVSFDGSSIKVRWSSTSLHRADGNIKNTILTGIDVTDQYKAEMLSRQRLLELGHIGRIMTMGEMATEIAHEINQPLGAIASYSDSCIRLIDEEGDNSDLIRQGLREIEKQALRSAEIIKHIRSFARKESGNFQWQDVYEIVSGIEDLIKADAAGNKVRFKFRGQQGLPRVWVDRVLIEQVVLNMARNSIEAMKDTPEGERELLISCSGDSSGVDVRVEDTGTGITAPDGLFDAFHTTKKDGIGLGLAMCHSIIASSGGSIQGKNREPVGAVFSFHLPVNEEVARAYSE